MSTGSTDVRHEFDLPIEAGHLARIAGKRLATTVARKVPVVGGVVGAGWGIPGSMAGSPSPACAAARRSTWVRE